MPSPTNNLQGVVFGAPIAGQSLTQAPKNAPYEKPPQFVKLKDAMNFLMDNLLESYHLKQLLQMMQAGMPIEAITRTLIFSGFAMGKWTVDLGMLMYKPLMLALIAMAHRAGLKDVPIVMPKAVQQKKNNDLKTFELMRQARGTIDQTPPEPAPTAVSPNTGFMQRSA